MTFSEELAIKEALRNGDGQLLAQTVRKLRFTDYDELEQFVSDQPSGWRHVSAYNGITVGDVRVKDRCGRPTVVEL